MKNTEDIKQIIIGENKALRNRIIELETTLQEFSYTDTEQTQQIDEIESSIAEFYKTVDKRIYKLGGEIKDEVEEKIESLPIKKSNPIIPFLMIGGGGIGVLFALGLSLDVHFGDSKISYKGEGVIGGLVQIVVAAVSGGFATKSFDPLRKLLTNKES